MLLRYRDELRGRVLELGSGAGRLTGYLREIAGVVHGIDLSARMIDTSRRRYPDVSFEVGDLRELSTIPTAGWDAVVAGFNVIDVLGHADRLMLLDEIHRLLCPGGLFVMSSHNREVAGRRTEALRLRGRTPGETFRSLPSLPRWTRNRRRLVRFERRQPEYAILNDAEDGFAALHYYISRDRQQSQLEAHGFELVECISLDGDLVGPGEVSESAELHYVARVAS
jgi:SAM-dependent methyltransferase